MKFKYIWSAFVIPFALLLTQQSMALTQAEYEAQVKAYEKQLKKLEKQAKKNKKRNRKVNRSIGDYASQFNVNGFFSTGLSKSDQTTGYTIGNITNEASFKGDAIMGVQLAFNFSENVSATTQLVTLFGTKSNANVEWAYLSYNMTDNFTIRAGRLRLPYYLLSEFLDVGYAYPWVRPPEEVYNVPISSYEGFDFIYRFEAFGWDAMWQTYTGGPVKRDDKFGVDFKLDDTLGHALEVSRGSWTFRTGYSFGKLAISENENTPASITDAVAGARANFGLELLSTGDMADYTSFGVRYDDSSWLVLAEITRLRTFEGATGGRDAHYISVGRRLGQWMPYTAWNRFRPSGDTIHRAARDVAVVEASRAENQATLDGLVVINDALVQLVDILELEEAGATLPAVINGTTVPDSSSVITQLLAQVPLSSSTAELIDLLEGNPDSFDVRLAIPGLQGLSAQLTEALAAGGTFDQVNQFILASRSGVTGQKSWLLGTRYDITNKISAKIEYQRIYDIRNGGAFAEDFDDDTANLYTIVVDAVW